MRFFHFTSIYSLLIGFGFAFSVKQFQSSIRDYFSPLENLEKDFKNLIADIVGKKENVSNSDFSLESKTETIRTTEVINDILKDIEKLEYDFKNLFSNYEKRKKEKQLTNNFNSLALLSAIFCLGMLFWSIIMRTESNEMRGFREAVLYFEIGWIGIILTLFIRDCFAKYNLFPVNKTLIFPLTIITLITLIGHIFYCLNSWIYSTSFTNFVILSSIFMPCLHYLLYLSRTIYMIMSIKSSFKKEIDKNLRPQTKAIQDKIDRIAIFKEFIHPKLDYNIEVKTKPGKN